MQKQEKQEKKRRTKYKLLLKAPKIIIFFLSFTASHKCLFEKVESIFLMSIAQARRGVMQTYACH